MAAALHIRPMATYIYYDSWPARHQTYGYLLTCFLASTNYSTWWETTECEQCTKSC